MEVLIVLAWIVGYGVGALTTLYLQARFWGPLPQVEGLREDGIAAYVCIALFWPVFIWMTLAMHIYGMALAPPKKKKVKGYDPAKTKELEQELQRINHLIEEHRK